MAHGQMNSMGVTFTIAKYRSSLSFSASWLASLKIGSVAEYFNAGMFYPEKFEIYKTFEWLKFLSFTYSYWQDSRYS